jgi:hypothetical protein
MMNLKRRLLAAGLVAALGAGAIAQAQTAPAAPASGPGHHMRGEHGQPDPARMAEFRAKKEARMAKHLGELKQKLQVTPAQENAWNTWTGAMKPSQMQRPDRAEIERLTTPERIDRMHALRAQRNAEMDRKMDATKNFYSVLNPQQKQVFDTESLRLLRGGKGGRHGHDGHHG